MKRIIALFLIIILCFLSTACNKDSTPKVTDAKDNINFTDANSKDEQTEATVESAKNENIVLGDDSNLESYININKPALDVEGHKDEDSDKECDDCGVSVVTTFDFYAINDLHGKFVNTDNTVGVEGLTTYLKQSAELDDNPILLSSGDMWQGGAESNLTKGAIITSWMNAMNFASMTVGNHEYDWGEEYVEANANLAKFPLLAINIYEKSTNKPVDYCKSSVIVECRGLQVGIIGAIGDCYSSISSDKTEDIYFKTGSELTALVKAEAEKLRSEGAELVIYSLHDGYGTKPSNDKISDSDLAAYYDIALSSGYVDLVFEGHSHIGYTLRDSKNVYHLQNNGDNGGISHAELEYNFANGEYEVNVAEQISSNKYSSLSPAPLISELLERYKSVIEKANEVVGNNSASRNKEAVLSTVAKLYYEAGNARWGSKYKIVLGGGFLSIRSPYYLKTGSIVYGDLQSILPFDNEIVLCSVKGRELVNKFLKTSNSNYYIFCGEYGNSVKNSINYNSTYYIITDTYSAYYAPNKLTIVESYGKNIFARDLLADYIKAGNWE